MKLWAGSLASQVSHDPLPLSPAVLTWFQRRVAGGPSPLLRLGCEHGEGMARSRVDATHGQRHATTLILLLVQEPKYHVSLSLRCIFWDLWNQKSCMHLRVDERQYIRENLKIAVYTILSKSPPARNIRIGVSLSHRPGREEETISESDGATDLCWGSVHSGHECRPGLLLYRLLEVSAWMWTFLYQTGSRRNLPGRHCKK